MSAGGTGPQMPAAMRAWVGAGVLGTLAYLSIVGFTLDSSEYFARVTARIFVAAASLMLVVLAEGQRGLSIDKRQRLLLMALVASTVASTLLAPRWVQAWDRLQLYYGLALLGFSVYMLHREDDRPAVAPYLWAIAIVHACVLIEVVFWLVMVRSGGDLAPRHMPYHSNIRHFGYLGYLAAAAAAALALGGRRTRLSALLLCTAALFGIVHLGSRGALLGWLVFLIAGAWLVRQRVRLLATGAAATALAFALSWGTVSFDILGGGGLIARAQQGELTGASGRLSLWSDVATAIVTRPVLGYGPDGHRVINCCGSYGPYVARTSQPHNLLLQLLEEFGVVGVALIAALVVRTLRAPSGPRGWRKLAGQGEGAAALAAVLCGVLVFGLVDGPFHYPVPLLIIVALAGLLLAATQRGSSADSATEPQP